jgi:hypothetical protein
VIPASTRSPSGSKEARTRQAVGAGFFVIVGG